MAFLGYDFFGQNRQFPQLSNQFGRGLPRPINQVPGGMQQLGYNLPRRDDEFGRPRNEPWYKPGQTPQLAAHNKNVDQQWAPWFGGRSLSQDERRLVNPPAFTAPRKRFSREQTFLRREDDPYATATYIQDPELPRSIYEVAGAEKVAIEINSFSKSAGFTGLRLGWSVVPRALSYDGEGSVHADWLRLTTTLFNGASKLVQRGALTLLQAGGWETQVAYYMENAKLLKNVFSEYSIYGGENAPYLWISFPGQSSWDLFNFFLEKEHLVVTPGVGFGPSGEGYIRISSFFKREELNKLIVF